MLKHSLLQKAKVHAKIDGTSQCYSFLFAPSLSVWTLCLQVKGKQNALKLIETLQPTVVIPLINAEFHSSGPLSKLIHSEGSPEDLQGLCKSHGLSHVTVRMPEAPGKQFDITV